MINENSDNKDLHMTKHVMEDGANQEEIYSNLSKSQQDNKPEINFELKPGYCQTHRLPSFTSYIEESDAFDKYLQELAHHTARYETMLINC